MLQQQEVELDGLKFTLQQPPAMRAMRLWARLAGLLAKPVAAALPSAKGAKTASDIDLAQLGPALEQLFAKLSPEEMEILLRELFATVFLHVTNNTNGNTMPVPLLPQFDTAMQGRPFTALKLAVECVRFYYSDFLGGLQGLAGQVVAKAPVSN
jgi:hypothetical protein